MYFCTFFVFWPTWGSQVEGSKKKIWKNGCYFRNKRPKNVKGWVVEVERPKKVYYAPLTKITKTRNTCIWLQIRYLVLPSFDPHAFFSKDFSSRKMYTIQNWKGCGRKNESLPPHFPRKLTTITQNKIKRINTRHTNKK